eukprot:6265753-Prymnesium_polylepis.1
MSIGCGQHKPTRWHNLGRFECIVYRIRNAYLWRERRRLWPWISFVHCVFASAVRDWGRRLWLA